MNIPKSCPICKRPLVSDNYHTFCPQISNVVRHIIFNQDINKKIKVISLFITHNNLVFHVLFRLDSKITAIYTHYSQGQVKFIKKFDYLIPFDYIISHFNTIINFS